MRANCSGHFVSRCCDLSLIGTKADILTLTMTKLGIVFILFIGRDGSSGTDGVKVSSRKKKNERLTRLIKTRSLDDAIREFSLA